MKFSWKDLGLVALAVLTFGIGWIASNQAAVIAVLAMAIVWFLSWLGKVFPQLAWIQGKAFLTILVFVAAFLLSLLIQPFVFPIWPMWTGDVATYVPLLAAFLAVFFAGFQTQVLFAIGIYNVLLAQVLDKLSAGLTARLTSFAAPKPARR